MSKMGEKFTEQQAREYEDRGANRSEELADLLTIAEMTTSSPRFRFRSLG
jgi:hypothetical protein